LEDLSHEEEEKQGVSKMGSERAQNHFAGGNRRHSKEGLKDHTMDYYSGENNSDSLLEEKDGKAPKGTD